jgi:hypothetical protein
MYIGFNCLLRNDLASFLQSTLSRFCVFSLLVVGISAALTTMLVILNIPDHTVPPIPEYSVPAIPEQTVPVDH